MVVNTMAKYESVIDKLEKSEFQFYLTGSKYFGGTQTGSDTDYFVQVTSPALFDFLRDLHAVPMDDLEVLNVNYGDTTIVSVWQLETAEGSYHFQIVRDAELKHQAQELLANCGLMHKVPKNSRKFLWNFALNIVRSQKV